MNNRVTAISLSLAVIACSTFLGCDQNQSAHLVRECQDLKLQVANLKNEIANLHEVVKRQEAEYQHVKTGLDPRFAKIETRMSGIEDKMNTISEDRSAQSDEKSERIQQQLDALAEQISQIKGSDASVGNRPRVTAGKADPVNTAVTEDFSTDAENLVDDLKNSLREMTRKFNDCANKIQHAFLTQSILRATFEIPSCGILLATCESISQ